MCFMFLFACEHTDDSIISNEKSPIIETPDTSEEPSSGETPIYIYYLEN